MLEQPIERASQPAAADQVHRMGADFTASVPVSQISFASNLVSLQPFQQAAHAARNDSTVVNSRLLQHPASKLKCKVIARS